MPNKQGEGERKKRKRRLALQSGAEGALHARGRARVGDGAYAVTGRETRTAFYKEAINRAIIGEDPKGAAWRLKEPLSIYQRRCWEGASTLKQNWDIFFLNDSNL